MGQNEGKWTNVDQHGAKRIPTGTKSGHHGAKCTNKSFNIESVRQEAIKKQNDNQKRSVQGCQPAFQDLDRIAFFPDLCLQMSDVWSRLGPPKRVKVME